MTRWFFIGLLILLIGIQPGFGVENTSDLMVPDTISDTNEMIPALDSLIGTITEELSDVREENRISAESLTMTGISGENATAVLSSKLSNVTYGHSSLIISPDNRVTAAAPLRYSGMVGLDLGYQPETQYANAQKSPVVSTLFYLEEGFWGISISFPIFSEEREYMGYTDLTIRPEEFLRPIISNFTSKTGYDVFILQPDGMTVYETNEVEIGKNVLTDPLYDTDEMRNVSHTVIDNQNGTLQYTFWNQEWKQMVPRESVWKTLKLDNQEWRIGIVRDLNKKKTEPSEPDTMQPVPEDLNASIIQLNSFVNNASEFAKKVGMDAASASFNNLSGPFTSGDRYIFAYDMNGTTLALPYQTGIVGENRMDLIDTNGLFIMSALIDAAEKGGQMMYYIYPNPAKEYQKQLKLAYVKPVDSHWFVGSGIYLPWVMAELNQTDINNLIDRVKNARRHCEEVGKEKAIIDFNDLNQTYAQKAEYIFSYDYNGTTLSLPYQSELIGTNRLNYKDIYGVQAISQEIAVAKRGGGFVYLVYYNPDSDKNELKLCYMLPAGDDWLVGSGIYVGTDLTK